MGVVVARLSYTMAGRERVIVTHNESVYLLNLFRRSGIYTPGHVWDAWGVWDLWDARDAWSEWYSWDVKVRAGPPHTLRRGRGISVC